jgi:acetyl-CoA carboxylase carboxyl transferase subunit beta
MIFKRPSNSLEGQVKGEKKDKNEKKSPADDSDFYPCPGCGKNISKIDLKENLNVCPLCSYHLKLSARRRISLIFDSDSFLESDKSLTSDNILDFPGYDDKILSAKVESGENEGVLTGVASVGGIRCAVFAMEPKFMMGSMGRVVGEKITRLFEFALAESLPVVGFTVSGGARMQEGILSLMQMAKTSGAVKRHSDAGNLYLCVLTDPTTGGVTASFAMEGDIIISEPGALICFAGPRVIEQTIRKKLPDGFQKAEFLLEKGFIDDIVDRRIMRDYIIKILKMHERRGDAV